MEQVHTTHRLDQVDEDRLRRFAQRLGNVVGVADLFDDGLGGDKEYATPPRPNLPPERARSLVHREYFAPVISLHPQVLGFDTQQRILETVS